MRRFQKNSPPGPTVLCLAFAVLLLAACAAEEPSSTPRTAVSKPHPGGRLVAGLRAEPKTLNPVTGTDRPSLTVLRLLGSALVDLDHQSQEQRPTLAKSITVSEDGRRFHIELPAGVKFSDGEALDADDVIFTWTVYSDASLGSPQRDYLARGGQEPEFRKLGPLAVELVLAEAPADGLATLDDQFILPEHRLGAAYREGRLAAAWTLGTPPEEIVGLGPFRLRELVPGERLVLERNPYYWRRDESGQALPYLDELTVLFVPDEESLVLRHQSGEIHLADHLGGDGYTALAQNPGPNELRDLGAGLEFGFLFFNLNELGDADRQADPDLLRRQTWFRDTAFRQAVSRVIDREGIVRLVYQGRATPIASHVSPSNKRWAHGGLEPAPRSPEAARELLRQAGYSWDDAGKLLDADGQRVAFSIVTSASNNKRVQMAAVIQEDLREIGIDVQVATLEFRALLDRLSKSFDYDACILGLTGNLDPNHFVSVWSSDGESHLWRLAGGADSDWQREIDRLLVEQATLLDSGVRKQAYDRIQEILAEQQPVVLLVSPNVLVSAHRDIGNFKPSVIDPQTLWNVDEFYWYGTGPR